MTSSDRPFGPLLRSAAPLLVVAVIILLTASGEEGARLALRYDREAIVAGEWWRWITGHLVHLGWGHLFLNLAGLVLVIALFPREYRAWQWLLILLTTLLGISAGFWFLRPELQWYVGLSGVLHGLYLAGALRWLLRGEFEGYLLAGFMVVKLIWEQVFSALPFSVSMAGGPVIVDAHLYGAVIGIVTALVLQHDGRWSRS